MQEAKKKALDATEEKIVELTTRVLVAKEKGRRMKEAACPRGTHDEEVGPSSTTQTPSSPQPLPSQASTYYQEWKKTLLDSIAVHLSQPPHNFDLHY